MTKIGRNAPCPCGSGKKYKKCHGDIAHLDRIALAMKAEPGMLARHRAKESQRTEQQGLGRPIIAAKMDNGQRIVAVNNRLLHSDKWKTFHDFLGDYIKVAIGSEWGNVELKKPFDQRHPILVWYHKLCEQQRLHVKEPGKVFGARMTGAVAAYMHLAYDLYALDHNSELQTKLIARLQNKDQFPGARYEVGVAATLIRAGFTLAFENEDDRNTSHCEFTAKYTKTGKQFSVEAKRAQSERVVRQLVRALKKSANHTRVVFIDLNTPDQSVGKEVPGYLQQAFDQMRRFEILDPQARRLPPAYVFLTNTPWEHHLDETEFRQLTLGNSFHIDEFKIDHTYTSLRAALNGRQAHVEMHEVLQSMHRHSDIPSTFDGDNPELAFTNTEKRLIIGERYLVPNADGTEVEGVLASAIVMEVERAATCIVNTDDGQGIIVKMPLTEEELAAWKRHPETFFGEISQNRKTETALDLYDFFMESYKKTPKSKLLEFLASAQDIHQLAILDQPQLASVYCERIAANAFAAMGPGPKPLLESKWRTDPAWAELRNR